jgi:DNA processing protein
VPTIIDSAVKPRDNCYYWLAISLIPRLAIHRKLALVARFGLLACINSPPRQEEAQLSDKQYHALTSPDWQKITNIITQSIAAGSQLISFDHANYPVLLKQIYDPPLVLFVRGDSQLLNQQQMAIVGSRNCSLQGRENASQFSRELASRNMVITSGLASGVDAFAHQAAVEIKKPTIAVMATGIDKIYPRRHVQLARNILATGGALITEFHPGTEPKPGHFPKRNRIISGLSLGVLIVEAAMKSGSLITARCALEQNREVFAVPGNIRNPQVRGCHWLIKQGAKLVEEPTDILEEVNFLGINSLNLKAKDTANKDKVNDNEKNCIQGLFNDALLASVGYEVTPVDTVISRSKLPTDEVLTRLTMLELKGLVSAVPGGYLKLNRG